MSTGRVKHPLAVMVNKLYGDGNTNDVADDTYWRPRALLNSSFGRLSEFLRWCKPGQTLDSPKSGPDPKSAGRPVLKP